jgi:transcriptional regulator with XRE-family HTH domain
MSSSSESKSTAIQSPRLADEPKRRRGSAAGTPGGTRLRAVREQAGRSQLWVEAEADLGTGYLQRVESGRVAQPGRATVERILDALDARYSERRDVLELFGYTVTTPLPTADEIAWAKANCQHELHDVPFPAYVLDCLPRLIAWNRFVPRMLGRPPRTRAGRSASPVSTGAGPDSTSPAPSADPATSTADADAWAESMLETLAGRPVLLSWFDPASPFGALVAEPDVFLSAMVRAMRYEFHQFRGEPWVAETIEEMSARLPRFREEWDRLAEAPPPISAARILVPVRLNVPGTGQLQFRLVSEPFVRDTRFRLIYFVPADPTTMRQCAAWASSPS